MLAPPLYGANDVLQSPPERLSLILAVVSTIRLSISTNVEADGPLGAIAVPVPTVRPEHGGGFGYGEVRAFLP